MIANAMAHGIRSCGEQPLLQNCAAYKGLPTHDVAIFYGLAMELGRILHDYVRTGRKAVYCDLGYWTRRIRTRHDGYHKLAVNDRHPTAYLMDRNLSPDRFERHGLSISPWRPEGRHILVAGMSAKAAWAEKLPPNKWEERTVARLRRLTGRPIIYRPKPNYRGAKVIPGAGFDPDTPLPELLRDCHAVVTHHSNVAVDALLAGVPVFSVKGVASLLGCSDLAQIEAPIMPVGREQWAHNLAWCQWSVDEMRAGLAYRYLIEQELI